MATMKEILEVHEKIKMLKEQIESLSSEKLDHNNSLIRTENINSLKEELEKAQKEVSQLFQSYDQAMLSRFIKMNKEGGQKDDEAIAWWMSRY